MSPIEKNESASAGNLENRKFHKYLRIEDISAYLNMNAKTLYAMVESGSIPHYRIGRLIRFRREDIDLWMESRKVIDRNPVIKPKRVFRPNKRNQHIDKIVRKTIDGLIG